MGPDHCDRCGADLLPWALEGLCPACVLAAVTAPPPHQTGGELAPGQTVGRYRIERLIGRGGMGEVYAAEEVEHGRRVALKVLTGQMDGPEDRERFLSEGRLAASLSHHNCVYIFGSEEIEGIPVIAMELLAGGTLKDRVERQGPLPPTEAVDAMLQIIAGLDAAHASGILHRDIKPSNCFTDRDGTVKVGDFGLSISTKKREVPPPSTTRTFYGTPHFAAPEQLRGEPLDVRSDIYAAGATLCYLLTGQPPFDGRDPDARAPRIAAVTPLSAQDLHRGIPTDLGAVVKRCLAKDQADRPATYADLANQLRPFSSAVAGPGPIGLRAAAGVFDAILVSGSTLLVGVAAHAWLSWDLASTFPSVLLAMSILYWGVSEGGWGTTYGKWSCGLRVVGTGGRRPGVVQARTRNGGRATDAATPCQDLRSSLTRRLGPYEVVAPLGATECGEILLACDPRLKRPVWIHVLPRHSAAVPARVRDLNQPGRLHWLSGQRTVRACWDAYAALEGVPLVAMSGRQSWRAVRQWLLDLARELEAGLEDASVGSLALDHVWVTPDGHAKLLDFRAPGAPAGPIVAEPLTTVSAQRFLHDVAHALGDPTAPPLPLSASACLHDLARAGFTSVAEVAATLAGLASQPDCVTRRQREMALALGVVVTVGGAVVFGKLLGPLTNVSLVARDVGALACALVGVLGAIVLRGGFWLRAFGIAVVTCHGTEASRWRAASRAAVVWSWVPAQFLASVPRWAPFGLAIWALTLVCLSWAGDHPERGLQDRVAGTYLVPR